MTSIRTPCVFLITLILPLNFLLLYFSLDISIAKILSSCHVDFISWFLALLWTLPEVSLQHLFFCWVGKLTLAQLLWFHSCDTLPGKELCCGDRAGLGASARNTETSLPWPGEHLPPILGNAQERTCIIPKPAFFRHWTVWWWSSFPPPIWPGSLWSLGPEELPDWVIFSEKNCKDEGFRCAFGMNHKSQAPGPMWDTCLLMVVGQSQAEVRCNTLRAVIFPRRIWHLQIFSACFRYFYQTLRLNSY